MTNAESYLEDAKDNIQLGVLTQYEQEFIEDIQDYSKKDLRKLTKKQFLLLRKCAR